MLLETLLQLKPTIVAAIQELYDSWDFSDGGMCDAAAETVQQILTEHGISCTEGGQDGDDHSYTIAYDDTTAYAVDIPYAVYERGGGYNWDKIEGVTFTTDDVGIVQTYRPDWVDSEG